MFWKKKMYKQDIPKTLTSAFIPQILIIDVYPKLQRYLKKDAEFYKID